MLRLKKLRYKVECMEFQVSTKLTPEIEIEGQKKIKKLCKIALIIGVLGLIAYILIAVIAYEENEEPFWLELMLWFFAVLFALGLIIPIVLKSVTKKSLSTISKVVNVYEFHEEYVIVKSYRMDEKIAEVKHYYSEITKIRQTENYVYLHLGLRGAYPITRSVLTEEQRSWLFSLKKK